MNELTMTVTGWVATDPKLHLSASGADFATFRLASTPRYFDRGTNAWADGQTEWFTVRAFRTAATFVSKSIRKSQPVTVTGRFRTHTWEGEDGPRTDLLLDAIALGHDLTRGVSAYIRAVVEPATGADQAEGEPGDADAAPEVEDEPLASEVERGDEQLETPVPA